MTFYSDCYGSITKNNPQRYTPTRCVCYSLANKYSGVSGVSFLVSSARLGKPVYGGQTQLDLYIAGVTNSDCAL